MEGEYTYVRMGESRDRVLDAMKATGKPMWPHEIAQATGMKSNAARQQAWDMLRRGLLGRGPRGYFLPETQPATKTGTGWHIGRGPTDKTDGKTTVLDAEGREVARFNRREDAERACGVRSGE